MWHTSRGDRTLQGDEASLVAMAIDTIIDALLVHVDVDCVEECPPECESGIDVYDRLTVCQRIGLLHEVAHYLLTATSEPLALSATADATVAAIFVEIMDQITIEIDLFGDDPDVEPIWRRHALAAHRGVGLDEPRPAESCNDIDVWKVVVDQLVAAILWDRDFEMSESFLDIDPGVSHLRRRLLGIHEDYFTSVAPDPRPEEAFSLISKTRDLVRSKPR